MKRTSIFLAAATLLTFSLPSESQEKKRSISDLQWLSGCWQKNDGYEQTDEMWMKPAGKVMLGMSRTVVEGKMMSRETMEIQEYKNGEIFYKAKPFGQNETSFRLVRWGEREAVFENLRHDFPHRIIYRLGGNDSLFTRIEGQDKEYKRGIDFPMKRVKCE